MPAVTFLASLALFASAASAQSVRIDQLTQFKTPYEVLQGAVVQLPDGRTYGFYRGGFNGGIYQALPDGHGGYTTTVVFDMPSNVGGVPASYQWNAVLAQGLAAGPDGKIYFVTSTHLSRFDPDALTVEDLVPTNGTPVALSVGNDGHTLFGAFNDGRIYTFDTTTSTYHDVGISGDHDLIGLVQMKDGSLFTVTSGLFDNDNVTMRELDSTTAAPLAAPITFGRSISFVPTKGDDGETYVLVRDFGDMLFYRVDPSCFCLQQLADYPYPNPSFPASSIVGPRNSRIYLNANYSPSTLDISVNPPVLTQLSSLGNTYAYKLLPDGTLVIFDGSIDYALKTQTATPGTTPTPVLAQTMPNDGLNTFPSDYTMGADGMLYGISDSSRTEFGSIFRVDPIANTHTVVANVDFGAGAGAYGYGTNPTKMALGPDGRLYGTFVVPTGNGGIYRFDPATDAVDVMKTLTIDPDTGLAGPDGAYPGRLVFGSDGLLHGIMSYENSPDYSGGIFTMDPTTGALVTVLPALDFGFYPGNTPAEASPGVWIGVYFDNDPNNTTGASKLYRFDQRTSTVTPLGFAGDGTFNPQSFARGADGALYCTASGYPTSDICTVDPNTGAVTLLTSLAAYPQGDFVLAADGSLLTEYFFYQGSSYMPSTGVIRFNPSTGQISDLGILPITGFSYPGQGGLTLGRDGRLFAGMSGQYAVYAIAVFDPIPIAPASGGFGQTTTVSATLKALGVPVAGRTIAFTLNGHAIGSAATNAQGVATVSNVSLNGIAIGTYASAIGASFAGDDEFSSTSGSGSLTVLDVPTPGLMVGDGFIRDDDFRYGFAFVVREKANGADRGTFALRVTNTDCPPKGKKKPKPRSDTFVSLSYSNVVFSDDPTIRPGRTRRPQIDTVQFAGPGLWNGQRGYRFEATAQDAGEPGRDRESLSVTIYDGANHVVVQFNGVLDGGNIQSVRIRH